MAFDSTLPKVEEKSSQFPIFNFRTLVYNCNFVLLEVNVLYSECGVGVLISGQTIASNESLIPGQPVQDQSNIH